MVGTLCLCAHASSLCSQLFFHSVKDWVNELRTHVQHDIVLAIAGNKADLVSASLFILFSTYTHKRAHD